MRVIRPWEIGAFFVAMATLLWLASQRRGSSMLFGNGNLSTSELTVGVVIIAVAVLAMRPWRRH